MPRHARAWGTVTLALLSTALTPVAAQERPSLADVAFLAGCWSGQTGAVRLSEHWTAAEGGMMLATTRFLRDGAVVDWEFARMEEDDRGVTLWPYPSGSLSEHGFPLVRTGTETVFENLEHDFPVRIIYAREGADALHVRIEGPDGQGRGWSVERAPCPSG